MGRPTKSDWNDDLRIFKYLRGTIENGITYITDQELQVFSDADYAECKRTINDRNHRNLRRWSDFLEESATAYSRAIHNRSRNNCCQRSHQRAHLVERNPPRVPFLKHINVRHLFLREKFVEHALRVEHFKGKNQPADICAKRSIESPDRGSRGMSGVAREKLAEF